MSASYYVIGVDGRPHGPMTADDIRAWVADGRAGRYSRIRQEGETAWRALQDLEAFQDTLKKPTPPASPPPAAAPDFVSRDLESIANTYAARAQRINIATSFARAWTLVSRNFVELSGWSLLAGLLLFLVVRIPTVGWLVGLVINSVLTGGVSFVFLARIRGRRVSLTDVTAAVAATLTNLCLAGLAQAVMTTAGLLLLILPGLYLAVGYAFTLPLTIDKRLPFWAAMEISRRVVHRQWPATCGLLLVSLALLLAAMLTFGVGLVLAMPLCTAALMYAYEDVFGSG